MQPQVFRRCPKGTEQRGPGQLCLPKETKGVSATPTTPITTTTTTTTKTPKLKPTPNSKTPKLKPTPNLTSKVSPASQALEAAPPPQTDQFNAIVFAPRPLREVYNLSGEQLNKANMISASYQFDRLTKETLLEEYLNQTNMTVDQYDNLSIERRNKIRKSAIATSSTEQTRAAERMNHSNEILIDNNLEGYTLSNLSTRDYLVLQKANTVEIIFRGAEGNLDPLDNAHISATIKGQAKDYSQLDSLMENIRLEFPDAEVEVVSYSNGGPKGIYIAEKYGLPHYSIDPVLGPREVQMLAQRTSTAPPLEIARAINRTNVASGVGTAVQEMMTGSTPANTKYLNIEPQSQMYSKPYKQQFLGEAHKLEHFSQADDPLIERLPVGKVGRGVVGSTVAGIVPSVLADLVVDKLAPEDQGEEGKKVGKAIMASGLTRVISPLAGAGAAGMADTLLPIYAGMQAGDITARTVDRTLPGSTSTKARRAIEGATAGAAGGAGFVATTTGQKLAGQAIGQGAARVAGYVPVATSELPTVATAAATATRSGGYALLATSEEAAIATEGLAAVETAGALVAAEETAAGIAALPIPGARPVAAAIALGALIGAGLQIIS